LIGAGRFDAGKFDIASQLFEQMMISDDFPEFLTLKAYEFLD
jgi:malate synthase